MATSIAADGLRGVRFGICAEPHGSITTLQASSRQMDGCSTDCRSTRTARSAVLGVLGAVDVAEEIGEQLVQVVAGRDLQELEVVTELVGGHLGLLHWRPSLPDRIHRNQSPEVGMGG